MKKNLVLFLSVTTAFAVCGGAIGAGVPGADRVEGVRPGAAVQGGVVAARSITFENLDIDRIIRNNTEMVGLSRPEIEVGLHRYNRVNALVGVELSQDIIAKLARVNQEGFESIVQTIEGFSRNFSSEPRMRPYFTPWVENLVKSYGNLDLAEAATQTLALAQECVRQGVNIHDEASFAFHIISLCNIGNMYDLVRKCKAVSEGLGVKFHYPLMLFAEYPNTDLREVVDIFNAIRRDFAPDPHNGYTTLDLLSFVPRDQWESLTGYLRERPNAFRNMSALDFQNSLYAEIKASLVNNTLNADSLTQALNKLSEEHAAAMAAAQP